eukprot:scaffold2509_cov169-Amphora_coffeaeformis.AAC.14
MGRPRETTKMKAEKWGWHRGVGVGLVGAHSRFVTVSDTTPLFCPLLANDKKPAAVVLVADDLSRHTVCRCGM